MPQRFLKPGIVTSLRLARCSSWAQLLYYKLLSLVDDYSRFDAHPTVVSRQAFPYGDHKGRTIKDEQIEAWLSELEQARIEKNDEPAISRYTVRGVRYLYLHRWTERCRSQKSRYPSPTEDSRCCQMLSDAVRRQQMLVPPPSSSSPSSSPSPSYNNGSSSMDQRSQFAAARSRIEALESVGEDDRTPEEDQELKKMRGLVKAIQKKQAANDFTPVNEAQ